MTIYGASGAVASATGLVISGFIGEIQGEGQGKAWRWFFRIAAGLILPVALGSFWIIPETIPVESAELEGLGGKKWKRLDLIGSIL